MLTKEIKNNLKENLNGFVESSEFKKGLVYKNKWCVRGFIDVHKNIYAIIYDTKIISKVIEMQVITKLIQSDRFKKFKIEMARYQNYYPDVTFIYKENERVKFALDIKTTYRLNNNPDFCNGFTLGTYEGYFSNRQSRKNIMYPYDDYCGHFCLCVIYTRLKQINQRRIFRLSEISIINPVISDLRFFVREKWEIARDSPGSGNTKSIGSIVKIEDLKNGNGVFKNVGEDTFNNYWKIYGKEVTMPDGCSIKIKKLSDYLRFKNEDPSKARTWERPS